MSPSRFQLEGSSLAEVSARVHAEYGPRARIIAAEAVTTGGISGFFAQRHYEVTVEVPDDTAQDAHTFDLPSRAGIAALLDDADSAEMGVSHEVTPPAISTASVDFQAIMADLAINTAGPPEEPAPKAPMPVTGAGDLVVVVGFSGDAVRVARALLGVAGEASLRIAGSIDGGSAAVAGAAVGAAVVGGSSTGAGAGGAYPSGAYGGSTLTGSSPNPRAHTGPIGRADDRRGLLSARASGVEGGYAVTIAYGLEGSTVDYARTEAIRKLNADQVWVAVDASRKEADTARWVAGVQGVVTVEGVIASNRHLTTTPESVNALGLPVYWE